MPNLTIFLSYVFVSTFTPGPNNLVSLSNASRFGFKKSIHFNYGVFVGFLIIISLSAVFSSVLYNIIPTVKPYMTVAGATYILYLAWKTFKSKSPDGESANEGTTRFSYGILLQFLNPKLILYALTITSTFITPYYSNNVIIAGFIIFLSLIGLLSTCSWSLFGSIFQKFFTKYDKIINTIMSLLLVYCALSLFIH